MSGILCRFQLNEYANHVQHDGNWNKYKLLRSFGDKDVNETITETDMRSGKCSTTFCVVVFERSFF